MRSTLTLPRGKRTPLCAVLRCAAPVVARLGPFAIHADPPPTHLDTAAVTWGGGARLGVERGVLGLRVLRFGGAGQKTPEAVHAHHVWMPFRSSVERGSAVGGP